MGVFSRPSSNKGIRSDPFTFPFPGPAPSGQPSSPQVQFRPQAGFSSPGRKRSNIVGARGVGLRKEYGIGQAEKPNLNPAMIANLRHTKFLDSPYGYDDLQR